MDTILFDLDGTLLPMNVDKFMSIYFNEMGAYFSDLIDPRELAGHIWKSTDAMVNNLEYITNESVFMEDFKGRIQGSIDIFQKRFDEFYDTAFLKVKESIIFNPIIKECVNILVDKGYKLVVATNPLFPIKAILHRIEWAGFDPSIFSYISSYEKNHFCKPQIKFYEEILKDIHKNPSDCLMVGNDVQEDLIAGHLGIKTFLIKDYFIHRTEEKIVSDYEGSYKDFYSFVNELPNLSI